MEMVSGKPDTESREAEVATLYEKMTGSGLTEDAVGLLVTLINKGLFRSARLSLGDIKKERRMLLRDFYDNKRFIKIERVSDAGDELSFEWLSEEWFYIACMVCYWGRVKADR